MTIGERIKQLRKRAELTQDKFAELCDATKGAVSQWEHDTTKPTLHNILLLRQKLRSDLKVEVSLDWLLCGEMAYSVQQRPATYDVRTTAQRVHELADQLNDSGLIKAEGFLECLAAEYPAIKAKRA